MSLLLFMLGDEVSLGLGIVYPITVTLDDDTIVAGDAFPFLAGTVIDGTGSEIDLTDPQLLSVEFVAAKANDGKVVARGDCTLAGGGRWIYHLQPSDFALAWPRAVAQLHLVYALGRQSAPSRGTFTVNVVAPVG
jgi:hypothetical protein